MTKKIPEGFTTITPTLALEDASAALALYAQAFGGKEDYRMEIPGSKKIMHACMTLGNSKLFLCDTSPTMCASPTSSRFYLYFEDVDGAFAKATKAGLETVREPKDMFWGDRVGAVKDKFGIVWTLASHMRDVSPEEMAEAQKQFCKAAA